MPTDVGDEVATDTTTATTEAAAPATESQPAAPVEELPRERVLELQVERLKRELDSMAQKQQRMGELVDEIDRADNVYETAKAEAKKAKEDREAAKASLRALVKGDAQVVVDFTKPDDGKQQPGPAVSYTIDVSKARAVAGTWGAWQFGLTRDALEKCDAGKLLQLEPELSKRKVGAVELLGDKPYIPLQQVCYADGSGYFHLWPLLEVDEWDATCAETYAHAIRDLEDESPDITAKRKKGGAYCGVTVKRGRKRMVVGPDEQAVRVVYAPDGVNGADRGYEAAAFLDPAANAAEVLSAPKATLPDRMEARLREYTPTSAGYHEGLATSLANDLHVEAGDIVAAAKADEFRFEVYLGAAGSESAEIVRLLLKDKGDGNAATESASA